MKYKRRITQHERPNGQIVLECYDNSTEEGRRQTLNEALEKLYEFEEKIENGTMVELPCKVGSKAWYVTDCGESSKIVETYVTDMAVQAYATKEIYKGGGNMLAESKETNATRIQKIKAEMGAHDETQQSLANKLGTSRTTIGQKLSGKTQWTVSELEALAGIYGKDRTYFF